MMSAYEQAYEMVQKSYNRHRAQYRENSYDSQPMCLMRSTNDPPDEIEGTDPFFDIEKAFGISINDEDALDLYNMSLAEATTKILELQKENNG